MVYRRKHSDYVNEFRRACLDENMPVARTELRILNRDEIDEIVSLFRKEDKPAVTPVEDTVGEKEEVHQPSVIDDQVEEKEEN